MSNDISKMNIYNMENSETLNSLPSSNSLNGTLGSKLSNESSEEKNVNIKINVFNKTKLAKIPQLNDKFRGQSVNNSNVD